MVVPGVRALAAVVVLAAFGTSVALASRDQAQVSQRSQSQRQVKRTIRAAVRAAVVKKDYRRACRFATARARRRLVKGYNARRGRDYRTCAALLRATARKYPDTVRKLRRTLRIPKVRVRGRRAKARLAVGKKRPATFGRATLVRRDGSWRIDDSDLFP